MVNHAMHCYSPLHCGGSWAWTEDVTCDVAVGQQADARAGLAALPDQVRVARPVQDAHRDVPGTRSIYNGLGSGVKAPYSLWDQHGIVVQARPEY